MLRHPELSRKQSTKIKQRRSEVYLLLIHASQALCEFHSTQTLYARTEDQRPPWWLSASLSQLVSSKPCQLPPSGEHSQPLALVLVWKSKTRNQQKTCWQGWILVWTVACAHLHPVSASVLLHLPGGITSSPSPVLSPLLFLPRQQLLLVQLCARLRSDWKWVN